MQALPGEVTTREHVPGEWGGSDVQAAATIRAAAQHACRHLLPLETYQPTTWRFAISLDEGAPGILEVDVLLAIGLSDITLRAPAWTKESAERLVKEIRENALALAPMVETRPAVKTDDLPF